MSGYPSITLQSHTTLQSSDDSFVQHSQNTHRGITLLNKLRSIFTEPSIFGGKYVLVYLIHSEAYRLQLLTSSKGKWQGLNCCIFKMLGSIENIVYVNNI